MTLTLTRALEIDIKLIPFEEEKALLLARRLWEFDGRPIERQALCRSLERILTFCQREGFAIQPSCSAERRSWSAEPGRLIRRAPSRRSFPAIPTARSAAASATP
jgi:hypothetical protein